ncbi:MAG: Type 1 glutamine amidotransferase-like domain-containing protein, partial [Clostridia bacterium]|nr:Type 1 glutamine amidotransferase-like domain-containing protein [Clostridia bacterium]
EKVILDCLSRGAMYIGGSAGAHIASRSSQHVATYDVDTYGLTDFSGLCLFDGILICHYSNLREKDYRTLIEAGEQKIIKLRDQDFMVFEI